ncbi:MAG TPA: DNA mismatch repair endonuclease MutL [Elusimicrobiota bacterium]|nr:DNA mismatch repair endonuclease MutL [Elusimicrobiota bacterium]
MARIQQLPEEVYSRIAAGEVVERPASMLKELLENSLDSGATRIDIEVTGAGVDSLRIVDDGCGMEAEDLKLCLGRHATSKISAFEDLDKLTTFGFRGEALYAISAVSRITITSATRESKTGWRVNQVGARFLNGPAPAIPGTTVLVTDLFYNTPARREFLKSEGAERAKLAAVVEEAAIANPGVRFTYKSEGRTVLRFEPENTGDPFQDLDLRAASVLGDDLANGLLPIDVERPGVKVRMLVSPLSKMPSSRNFQYFFVNKRPVSSRLLQQALYKGYGERPSGKHPVCVAMLELNPDAFDVNVHPGKREIRFKNDGEMFGIVSGLVASALAKAKAAEPITVEPAPAAVVADAPAPAVEAPPAAAPAPGPDSYYLGGHAILPDQFKQLNLGAAVAMAAPEGAPAWYTPPFRYIGQIERAYLLFEAAGGLFMLDQHAAAERILFEKLMAEVEHGGAKSQKLMLPIPVALPASATRMVLEKADRLRKLGFDVEGYGKSGLHVTAVPALFASADDVKKLIHRVIDALNDPVDEAAALRHDAIATVACKAAVKAHDRLGEDEAYKLLDELKDCQDGSCCPHGRRAMLSLNREELARRFQRPGAVPL